MQLVIAEKPSVAQQIASVIGAEERKDGYMEGSGSIVSWCVGHLVELAQPDAYSDAWKKWTYESLPMIPENWQHEVKRDTAAQYKVLRELMHDTRVDSVVCATDAGREGELIFRLVYEMAGCNKPMKRLWISSMEESITRRIPCCLQWREPEQRTWAIMWNAKGLARLPPEPTLSRSW